jgi:hypothetical protein
VFGRNQDDERSLLGQVMEHKPSLTIGSELDQGRYGNGREESMGEGSLDAMSLGSRVVMDSELGDDQLMACSHIAD